MKGKEALIEAFDPLFNRAAAKLGVDCTAEERDEAKRSFAERYAAVLDVAAHTDVTGIPVEVMATMQQAIDDLSPAQVVGYLAALPLARQAKEMARLLAYRAAEQRLVEHLVSRADDKYGGN